jgi:hypothetical protein
MSLSISLEDIKCRKILNDVFLFNAELVNDCVNQISDRIK